MNTKYNVGDKVWLGTYRNRAEQLEVLPIRDGFNDLSLIAEPKEFSIQEIRINDKEIIYGTKVLDYMTRRCCYGMETDFNEYWVWYKEIDIFNSKKECQQEKEIQGNRFIRKRTGKCTCCCCCKCCNK